MRDHPSQPLCILDRRTVSGAEIQGYILVNEELRLGPRSLVMIFHSRSILHFIKYFPEFLWNMLRKKKKYPLTLWKLSASISSLI